MGSTLTVERFLEMRQEDLLLEEAKYRRFFGEQGRRGGNRHSRAYYIFIN